LALLLVVLTFAAYAPLSRAGFIWDDDTFLTANPVIHSPHGLYQIWFTTATPDYFPLTSTTLWIEWRLWGGQPFGFHLINVLLHALSATLLWRVFQRLSIPLAWLAGAVFALHPVNVESVAWIAERKNTLTMVFYAGAMLAWLKFEATKRGLWYGTALAAFVLALLSKSAVAPAPLVLLILIWWKRGAVHRRDLIQTIPFFIASGVFAVVTIWFQSQRSIGHEIIRTDGFWSRLAGAGWAVWFYVWKDFWPTHSAFVYPRWQIDPRNALSYVPVFLLVAVLGLAWFQRKTVWGRGLLIGLGYFVIMLLPVLGFLNIFFMRYSFVADHWQYFAMIGPVALMMAGMDRFLRWIGLLGSTPKVIAGATLLLALGWLTFRQCKVYRDSDTLWTETLRLNPNSWMAHNNYGFSLLQRGDLDTAMFQFDQAIALNADDADAYNNRGICFSSQGKFAMAMTQFDQALKLRPDFYKAHNDLGLTYLATGRIQEAKQEFLKALELYPAYPEAHFNLGNARIREGNTSDAIAEYEEALKIQPNFVAARLNLADSLVKLGQTNEALAQLDQAVRLQPKNAAAHYNYGNSLAQLSRIPEAAEQFQRATELDPRDADAHFNLGACLGQMGRTQDALAQFQQANDLSQGRNPVYLHRLASALASTGRVDEAVALMRKAIQVASDAGRQDLARHWTEEMRQYQSTPVK
jgi:tetratricopeptide (TPR) repeat protein